MLGSRLARQWSPRKNRPPVYVKTWIATTEASGHTPTRLRDPV